VTSSAVNKKLSECLWGVWGFVESLSSLESNFNKCSAELVSRGDGVFGEKLSYGIEE